MRQLKRRRCCAQAVGRVHRTPSLILDLGVRDGRLGRNVAEKVNLPRPVRKQQRHLTIGQVERVWKTTTDEDQILRPGVSRAWPEAE